MAIVYVRATYTEQDALEKYFTKLFGWGKTEVIVRRSGLILETSVAYNDSGNVADTNALCPES